ncbi:hypothetical protein PSACC_02215 [Paramicrosporidium saccamoebae]|uniref:Uncharacterized protein n=1 Tax=Paramicrosporidium saccamoebae TaxID=1246581 RepID=A0A2H9TJG2_9FUNG|nr:hypothetical protein PSACC_02215 [Paramicrosporidium saccamoebae]
MRVATFWILAISSSFALQIHVRVVELLSTVKDFAMLLQSISYTSETIHNLQELISYPGSLRLQCYYATTTIPPEAALEIYQKYIDDPRLHRVMLPVDFFINNPALVPLIRRDWYRYRPTSFDLWNYDYRLREPEWSPLVLEYISENPQLAGAGQISVIGRGEIIPKSWELYRGRPTIGQDLEAWKEDRSSYMILIHALSEDPMNNPLAWSQTFPRNTLPQDFAQCRPSFINRVLGRLKFDLEDESMPRLCLWHGKLVLAILGKDAQNEQEFVVNFAADYLLEYTLNHKASTAPPIESISWNQVR